VLLAKVSAGMSYVSEGRMEEAEGKGGGWPRLEMRRWQAVRRTER